MTTDSKNKGMAVSRTYDGRTRSLETPFIGRVELLRLKWELFPGSNR